MRAGPGIFGLDAELIEQVVVRQRDTHAYAVTVHQRPHRVAFLPAGKVPLIIVFAPRKKPVVQNQTYIGVRKGGIADQSAGQFCGDVVAGCAALKELFAFRRRNGYTGKIPYAVGPVVFVVGVTPKKTCVQRGDHTHLVDRIVVIGDAKIKHVRGFAGAHHPVHRVRESLQIVRRLRVRFGSRLRGGLCRGFPLPFADAEDAFGPRAHFFRRYNAGEGRFGFGKGLCFRRRGRGHEARKQQYCGKQY